MIIEVSSTDFIDWKAKGAQRIAQNVQNLLNTVKFETAYSRNKGRSGDEIDMNFEEMKNLVIAETYEIVEEYEPRAEVLDVEVISADAKGEIAIKVVLEIEGS